LTQEFFSRLLEKQYLKDADPARGRFRSFLLASVRHFLANDWNREQCQKRGGGMAMIALDAETAEGRYMREPSNPDTPERLFERRWALEVLDRVMASFRDSYEQNGRLNEFEQLVPFLTGSAGLSYAELARQWNSSEGAVKVAVHRFRKQYRRVLRENIAGTVASEADIDDEIRFLLSALGRPR
jgi:RNA polymerase sigma-70 factor (ECF subfamily)